MSDIKCVVCGEPWEAYGLTDSMATWEVDLFRKGAGCPTCCGVGTWEPSTIDDVDNGDEDPMARLCLAEVPASERPKWIRPVDVVSWSCAACGTEVRIDCDDGEPYADGVNRYQVERDQDIAAPHATIHGCSVCVACAETCCDCGVDLCGALSDDTYDGFSSFPDDDYRSVRCVDCFETWSGGEADRSWESWARSNVVRTLDAVTWSHGLNLDDVADGSDVADALRQRVYDEDRQRVDDDTAKRAAVAIVRAYGRRPTDPRRYSRFLQRLATRLLNPESWKAVTR